MLVTWGSYGLGVFKGDKPLEYKTGTGYIHKRHRKGGRSQKRFARRTEEQKKDFLRKVANHIDERFKVYNLERISFGGNRLLLQPLLEESPYLSSKADRIYKSLLDVRHVDRETLLKSAADISSSLVLEF
ncbi:Vms1/Ankzf1 family peptidyl-tRNA hydrolase [Chloroflexota bacterium]